MPNPFEGLFSKTKPTDFRTEKETLQDAPPREQRALSYALTNQFAKEAIAYQRGGVVPEQDYLRGSAAEIRKKARVYQDKHITTTRAENGQSLYFPGVEEPSNHTQFKYVPTFFLQNPRYVNYLLSKHDHVVAALPRKAQGQEALDMALIGKDLDPKRCYTFDVHQQNGGQIADCDESVNNFANVIARRPFVNPLSFTTLAVVPNPKKDISEQLENYEQARQMIGF